MEVFQTAIQTKDRFRQSTQTIKTLNLCKTIITKSLFTTTLILPILKTTT